MTTIKANANELKSKLDTSKSILEVLTKTHNSEHLEFRFINWSNLLNGKKLEKDETKECVVDIEVSIR